MSGARSASQAVRLSIRCLIELTFQVAMRMSFYGREGRGVNQEASVLAKNWQFSKRQNSLEEFAIPGVRAVNGRACRGPDMVLLPACENRCPVGGTERGIR